MMLSSLINECAGFEELGRNCNRIGLVKFMYSNIFFSTEKSFDKGKVVKMAKNKMAATKYVFSHLWQCLSL
jgi:hypothetical protein